MEDVAVTDGEVGGVLEVLNPTGHIEVRWGKEQGEAEHAEAVFNDMLKKGYLAFKKTFFGWGWKGKQSDVFDPKARVYIFEKPEAKLLETKKDSPVDVADVTDEAAKTVESKKDGPIQVEAEREDSAKLERFEAAKKERDEAFERVKPLRAEAEETAAKRRDALAQRDTALRERGVATDAERAADLQLAAAVNAFEVAQRERDLAAAQDDVEKRTEAAKRVEVTKTEVDAAGIALGAAKKAVEETAVKAKTAQDTLDAAVASVDAARKRRNDAEKAYDASVSVFNDAERELKGEPTYEQTRKFDKKADHVMTPPMRGG